MKRSRSILIAATGLLIAAASLSGCGNTIRGVGQDTANAVDATQAAGRNVDDAASN